MSGSLIDIKKRIASTKKTSQITSAMRMVAASKLTKSEQSSRRFQEYASKIRSMTTHLASSQLQAIENADFSSFGNDMEMYHETCQTFSILMGDEVEPRKNFILEHAQYISMLDIW